MPSQSNPSDAEIDAAARSLWADKQATRDREVPWEVASQWQRLEYIGRARNALRAAAAVRSIAR